jgi:phenylacetate-coenzyme A ligase PaaK-like adenylate-forming protein
MKTVALPGDVVQIMLPSGPPNSQADLLGKGVKKMGGAPILVGTAPTPEQVKAIREFRPKVLFGSTSRVYRLTKEAEVTDDLSDLGVKVLFTTSEYLSPSMRENLKRSWHADVIVHYGLTEMGLGVAVECQSGDGYHFNEADLLLEIVDPETGEVLGLGEEGEMVFTTLNREAMPLIRYRTHDISKLLDKPCDCGATSMKKFAPTTRRKEGVVKTKAGELYPSLLDEAIFKIPNIVDWRAEFVKDGAEEGLRIQVETTTGTEVENKEIRNALLEIEAIRQGLKCGNLKLPEVEILASGSLTRTARAKKLILDNR